MSVFIEIYLSCIIDPIMFILMPPLTEGKSLKEMEESLSSFGVKQGCKLMMIGKRVIMCFVYYLHAWFMNGGDKTVFYESELYQTI